MTKSLHPFLFIILTIFIALAIPDLFADGMFMDGLMYAVVAKNLAHGEGSFWFLHFSDTLFSSFHEHPPLVFGIESIFYKIFGDSVLVEKLFSFATYFISGLVLVLIWKEITQNKLSIIAWLPLLLWVPMPLVHWGAVNNMLENTMLIFVCLSVLFTIRSLSQKRYFYLILSGLMLFAAFMCKGFTGLFPLSLPFWLWCFYRTSAQRFIADTLLLLLGIVLPLIIIYFLQPVGIESLRIYLFQQVFKSIEEVQTVNTRFYILWKLFTELLIPAAIVLLVLFIRRKDKSQLQYRSWIFVFLALGLSGVLPIMVSLKQNGFYIICTLPFFAIAMALIISSPVKAFVENIDLQGKAFKVFKLLSILLLLSSITLALVQNGKTHQHKNLIYDVKEVAKVLPPNSIISVPIEYAQNWSMFAYFQRYAGISLEASTQFKQQYLFLEKSSPLPSDYQLLDLNTKEFQLCRRK
ncbi:MAG: glycosyltransferase family 39 protein [Bacteroidetes bacterium]|nr:glycosyltransferase family 39 protein [Bacteroidota bacterium]